MTLFCYWSTLKYFSRLKVAATTVKTLGADGCVAAFRVWSIDGIPEWPLSGGLCWWGQNRREVERSEQVILREVEEGIGKHPTQGRYGVSASRIAWWYSKPQWKLMRWTLSETSAVAFRFLDCQNSAICAPQNLMNWHFFLKTAPPSAIWSSVTTLLGIQWDATFTPAINLPFQRSDHNCIAFDHIKMWKILTTFVSVK